MRAEPKIVTAGLSSWSTTSKPRLNSSLIRSTRCSSSESSVVKSLRSSTSEAVLRDVRGPHTRDEEDVERHVEHADRERGARAVPARLLERPVDGTAVEPARREEVDQVQQEAGVGERGQQLGVARRRPAR